MRQRNQVLGLLSLLLVITYLDRVCISVAGPRMQQALGIGPVGWGWVTGVFTLAYASFEIPSGVLGDRIGARRVLTRIVLWWSAFTSITGAVTGFHALLATRFLFGAGEAGAFPNASIVVARWFPVRERGRAFGVILMSAQLGGALAPLLVVPLQRHFGWRASFYAFGILGCLWSVVWYRWFRDNPREKAGVKPAERAELEETEALSGAAHRTLPWSLALRSTNFWAVMAVAFCYIYTNSFFTSWFHTYLAKGHGFREQDLLLTFLPFLLAAVANLCGGWTSQWLVRRAGLKWGRCAIGVAGLSTAAFCMLLVFFCHGPLALLLLLSLANAGITFQQPILFAVCLDIGGAYAGAIAGAMNTASQGGAFVSSVAFGYLVNRFGRYDVPLIPMTVLLGLGALMWLKIDPARPLSPVEMTDCLPVEAVPEV